MELFDNWDSENLKRLHQMSKNITNNKGNLKIPLRGALYKICFELLTPDDAIMSNHSSLFSTF